MLIHYDPDEFEPVYERRTCSFHAVRPSESFAGCTCSSSISSRRRTDAEIAAIKLKKQTAHEDRILAEAEFIRARRAGIKVTEVKED